MDAMNYHFDPTPDDDTAAAILAAIACCLEHERTDAADMLPPRSAWASAAALAAQELPPTRAARPAWGSAERAKRANLWSSGIVGV